MSFVSVLMGCVGLWRCNFLPLGGIPDKEKISGPWGLGERREFAQIAMLG